MRTLHRPLPFRPRRDCFPPPFAIPQTSNDMMLPSPPSVIPPTATTTNTTAARSGGSSRNSKERSAPVSVLRNGSGRRIGAQDRSGSPSSGLGEKEPQQQQQNATNTVIVAAVGGAIVASLAILVVDRLRRG
ncbi:hypothetical protein BASA82_000364 [Batrachochytrium salamandrivorans]|nr:hypothetical protein BASA82_000364 [Batrachochytrium salamandrivorans]